MITYSIIQKSQLEGANRLDAEYYQPEYLDLKKRFNKISFSYLNEVSNISGGKRLPLGEDFSEEGIPYIRVVDIKNNFIDYDNNSYISEELHDRLKKYQIKNKDILVTIVGNTVGLTAFNQGKLLKCNFTENCARVRAASLSPEFLFAVLISNVGQLQVNREKVGVAQPKLSLDRLRNFKIPLFSSKFQKPIQKLVIRSRLALEKSKEMYEMAENLLLEKLGLKDFKPEDELAYIVNSSEIESAHRADAEYFQPKYEELISKIKNKNAKLLGDLILVKKGIEPGSGAYQEEGKLFIRVSSLSKFGIEDKDQKYLTEDLYRKLEDDFKPRVGEILLSKDATPGLAYVLKEPIEGIIAGGILRLKLKTNIEPEYLALVLNSVVGQMQVERDTGGSVILHWRPDQIKNCLIPILPKSTQQKIANLVRQSHQARKKSKELLENAKRKVEQMIGKKGE